MNDMTKLTLAASDWPEPDEIEAKGKRKEWATGAFGNEMLIKSSLLVNIQIPNY